MKKSMTLALFIIAAIAGCKKKDAGIIFPGSYTGKMGGMRNWHGKLWGRHYYMDTASINSVGYDSAITATFAIEVLSATSIKAMGSTLTYYTDTTGAGAQKVIRFRSGDMPPVVYVTYYYEADSMHYEFDNDGTHVDEHEYLATP